MIINSGTIVGGTYRSTLPLVPMSGLVAYFDAANPASYPGSGTTWYDLSGNGNDVTMQSPGSILYHPGGGAYFSTGINGFFYRGFSTNLPTGGSSYTFSAWIQLGSTWGVQGIMAVGSGWGTVDAVNAFRTNGTLSIENYWWGDDFAQGFSIPSAGDWINVVAQWDGTTRTLWVNGTSIGSKASSGLNVSDTALGIGVTNNSEYLNGNIGQALIYNRALTSDEINAIYNNVRGRYGV